jgi:solute carrier family 35, member E1
MKKDFQLPWSSATIQLVVGLFYAIPLWLLKIRKIPKLTYQDLLKLFPIALLNAGGHACAVNAMFEKGGGSFTHVIKASEPVVSVILGFLVNRVVPRPLTAASLLPITYGVAYASTLGNLNVQSMSKELTTKAAK